MTTDFPILYIEDDETDVMLLQHVFKKVGITHPLQVLTNGKAALDYLAGQPPFDDRARHPVPGLVLLDLNLPFRSGSEVLAWLRQQPALRRLPVLVLSSSTRPEDIATAYDKGANGYLVEPSSLEEFCTLAKAVRDFWLIHNRFPEPFPTGDGQRRMTNDE